MDQVSFYRKYRPHNFDNLVGQDHVKTTLINALKTDRVTHAYLFTGPRGTGKTSCARLIAKALCCVDLEDKHEPCGKCEFCMDINEGRLIDLIEIDAASNRGIDEVRDLREKINFAPTRAKYKIYIIDEVHMMTKEAFNALLKTLEEPPAHAYFILATTEVHKIPETIISRCQRFDFKRITIKALMTRLSYICQKEEIKAEDEALELISRYVDGGLRDAIGLLEQLSVDGELSLEHVQDILGVSSYGLLEELYELLNSNNTEAALQIINNLHGQGSDLKQFIHDFVDMLRKKMLEAVSGGKDEEVGFLIRIIDIFQETQQKMLYSPIVQLPLEIAVIRVTGNYLERKIEIKEEPKKDEEKKLKEKDVVEKVEEKEKKEAVEESEEEVFAIEINLENLQQKWPRITERIKSPSLRMSLRGGAPIEVDGEKITLEFQTNFHKDKVVEHDHRIELESVIQDLFGHPVKVLAKVRPLEIKPEKEDEKVMSLQSNQSEKNFVDQALEIFGGEVME